MATSQDRNGNGRGPRKPRPFTIGRSRSCDLTIDHPRVSRIHCTLSALPDGMLLRDHDSRNGTWVMGERIGQCFVDPPMRIRVGKVDVDLLADGSARVVETATVADGGSNGKTRAPQRKKKPNSRKTRPRKRRFFKRSPKKPKVDSAAIGADPSNVDEPTLLDLDLNPRQPDSPTHETLTSQVATNQGQESQATTTQATIDPAADELSRRGRPTVAPTWPALALLCVVGVILVVVFTQGESAPLRSLVPWTSSPPADSETIWRSDDARTEWAEEEYLDIFPLLQERLAKVDQTPRGKTPVAPIDEQATQEEIVADFELKLPPPGHRNGGTRVVQPQLRTVPFRTREHDSAINLLLVEATDLLKRYHVRYESVTILPSIINEISSYDNARASEVLVELHHRDMKLLHKLEKRMKRLRVPKPGKQSGLQKARTEELSYYLADLLTRQRKHLLEMEEIIFSGMTDLENEAARMRLLKVAFENPDSRRNVRVAQITTRWNDATVVPILIDALRTSDSSLRSAIRDSLRALTGKRYHTRSSWEKWWNESHDETKEVAHDH